MLVLTQSIGKIAYEALVLPVTERVVRYIKKVDGIDTYDRDISYNMFSLKVS